MNKNFGILILFATGALFGRMEMAEAARRGIGVSPAAIELEGVSSWPHTAPLLVTNLSQIPEWFEITFGGNGQDVISVQPSRFPLQAGETSRVLATFENPNQEVTGVIRIAAIRTSSEGFETGTGIELPFRLKDISSLKQIARKQERNFSAFSASAGKAVVFGSWQERIWGGVIILASIIFLWFLAIYGTKKLFRKEKSV